VQFYGRRVTAFEQLISRRSLMGAAQSDLGNTP
jgi:hypothetical protein